MGLMKLSRRMMTFRFGDEFSFSRGRSGIYLLEMCRTLYNILGTCPGAVRRGIFQKERKNTMSFIHVQPIIKKSKKIVIYEDAKRRQWIGDSCAAYRLYDIPFTVDHNNILDIMGVSDSKRKQFVPFYKVLPDVYLGDYGEAVDWMMPFMYDGDLYQVIRSGTTTICVLEHYLKPLKCFENKEYRIEEVDGLRYLVVNVGAMAVAVITGEPVGRDLIRRLQFTVDCLDEIAAPEEPRLFDRETGEVLQDEEGSI